MQPIASRVNADSEKITHQLFKVQPVVASATGRDPRLQRKSKPTEADAHNFSNPNNVSALNPSSLVSPVKKIAQSNSKQQHLNVDTTTLSQTGVKRTSPNSTQSPNPAEIKKPKYTITSKIPTPNEEKMNINTETTTPLKTAKIVKKTLLQEPPQTQIQLQQQEHHQVNAKLVTAAQAQHIQHSAGKLANQSQLLQQQQVLSKPMNKFNEVESSTVKSAKTKQ